MSAWSVCRAAVVLTREVRACWWVVASVTVDVVVTVTDPSAARRCAELELSPIRDCRCSGEHPIEPRCLCCGAHGRLSRVRSNTIARAAFCLANVDTRLGHLQPCQPRDDGSCNCRRRCNEALRILSPPGSPIPARFSCKSGAIMRALVLGGGEGVWCRVCRQSADIHATDACKQIAWTYSLNGAVQCCGA